jgi:hypothetical protein
VRCGEIVVDESAIDLILIVLDYIVTISFEYILYCGCFHLLVVLNSFVMCGFCNVCFGNMYSSTLRLP